jgi:hypothetical protein
MTPLFLLIVRQRLRPGSEEAYGQERVATGGHLRNVEVSAIRTSP